MNQQHDIEISIVSPVYKAEMIVESLVNQICLNVEKITLKFEIILVEDGSPDNSWEVIKALCLKNSKVKGVKLSRNFGQHYAITAGLEQVKGKRIVVMDCDLQDKPSEIHKLYSKALEGYDIVYAQRINRSDNLLKKLSSKIFYTIFSYLTDTKQDASIANFGIYSRNVIHSILSMKDHIRFFPTMSQWVGYNSATVIVKHDERESGKSTYTLKSLVRLALDNIVAFSDKPLRLTVKFGFFLSLFSGLTGLIYLLRYLLGYIQVQGYSSLIISIWFLSGIIIFVLGMIGVYLGKTFEKVKDRPIYIIDEFINNQ